MKRTSESNELEGVSMKVTFDYQVPDVSKSLGLFEKGLQEAMNRAAKRFGLKFARMTVEIEEDEKPSSD